MKIAYFDVQFGAAGDMLNAALLAAGLDESLWRRELAKLALPEGSYVVRVSDVMRCHVACKKVDVLDGDQGETLDAAYARDVHSRYEHSHARHGHAEQNQHTHGHWYTHTHAHEHHTHHADEHAHPHGHAHSHEHGHAHEHAHEHEHPHEHAHEHEHPHEHAHPHDHEHAHEHDHPHEHHAHNHKSRGLVEIVELIEKSGIRDGAKRLAQRIFRRLAQAESQVHGVKPEDVHFHEVGAIDAIVDIVGFSIGYDLLGIEKSFCSAVAIGAGKCCTEHGLLPVPGPATLYLLSEANAAIANSTIDFECLTPTGAAILCEIASDWGTQPGFASIDRVGYGAGSKDPGAWPNACRVVLGTAGGASAARFDTETVVVLEANIDDLNPQTLSFTMERLLAAGALDAFITPVLMKKGRSGHLLTVLCRESDRQAMEQLIMTETSTLGVRGHQAQRCVARREWSEVTLERGDSVRIKIARDTTGAIINIQPEYEDCAAYATKYGLPLKDVLTEAMVRFNKQAN